MATDENTVRIAVLETKMGVLETAIPILITEIKALTEAMNKGKGAFTFALLFSGAAGGVISILVSHFVKS